MPELKLSRQDEYTGAVRTAAMLILSPFQLLCTQGREITISFGHNSSHLKGNTARDLAPVGTSRIPS